MKKTKMIFNKIRLLLPLGVLLLASCNEEPYRLPGGDLVPAVFTSGFAEESGDGDHAPQAETRANNNTWTASDPIGIYMLNGSNYDLSTALEKNKYYLAASAATSTTLTPYNASNTIYYPADGRTVRFVAYSPYASGATSANQVTYSFATQNSKANKEAKDFIFYLGTTNRSSASATETMTFKHRFSKINITVKQGTNGISCAGLTMTLTRMPSQATVNLATVAADATQTATTGLGISTTNATISPWTSASSAASATVEGIVAPHTGSGNFTSRTFTFTASGATFTYTLPNTVTFETGKVYNFEFTLTQTAAVFNTVTISDWTVGTSYSNVVIKV